MKAKRSPRRINTAWTVSIALATVFSIAAIYKPGESAARLTIDLIMRGPRFAGYEPHAIRWSSDSKRLYFEWKMANDSLHKDFDIYVVNADGTGLRTLSAEEQSNAPPITGELSRDRKTVVFVENGDIFLYDRVAGARRQLTSTLDAEEDAHLTQDQRHVYFTRSNNLFVMSLEDGSVVQKTDIHAPGPASNLLPASQARADQNGTGSREFLRKEQRELFEVINERAAKREEDEAKNKNAKPRRAFQLQELQTLKGLQLSPDEKYVIAIVGQAAGDQRKTVLADYMTESAYTEEISSRPKTGDNQILDRLAIIDAKTGEAKWLQQSQTKELNTKSRSDMAEEENSHSAAADRHDARDRPSKEAASQGGMLAKRVVQLFRPLWSRDGTKSVVQAKAADNKDRWILALDLATATTRVIYSEHDDAWVVAPGAILLGWMPDNENLYFLSQRTGYSQIYTVPFKGGYPVALTSGNWDVTDFQLSEDLSVAYLTTTEVSRWERHVYVRPIAGGKQTRITAKTGSNQVFPSPDNRKLALLYSCSNRPPELFITDKYSDVDPVKITSSPAPEFFTFDWVDPPIVSFIASDGATVYARLYRPRDFKSGGPAVIFVHGAGYMQNVHRYWSTYYREYMFHHFLMENGYTVMDVDYRGSSGYGRDWRIGIYRHMGGRDLEDEVDAARWLARSQGVDPKRIGIYGGSYGGFMTLMAMFVKPGVFAAGAALRPVSDWAHYNHYFSTQVLNLPQNDAEAYRQSSPIYSASGLQGALLICHGMVDTNVHFQDTARLVQKLIELHKENWEVAIYPAENHAFEEPSSWADEYKRVFRLFERNLKGNNGHETK
jgi:dipeptidyl aminopeptidase/acylaminoacyl peptidase